MLSLWTMLLRLIDSFRYPKCRLCNKRRLVPGVSSEILPTTVCVFCWKHERGRVRWHNKRAKRHKFVSAHGKRVSTRQWMAMLHQHDYGCISCGKGGRGNLTLDHIISLNEGGNQSIENLQPLCISCHSTKDGWKARPLYVRLWEKLTNKVRRWKRKLVKSVKSVYFRFWF